MYVETTDTNRVDFINEQHRVLFCNIAYMEFYDATIYSEIPINGGAYVKDTKDALEKYNFHRCQDGSVKGFVETKYYGGYKAGVARPNQLHIENIDPAYKKSDSIDNVTVIFCANNSNDTVVVGWYTNATVYRNRKIDDELKRQYNIEASFENAHLIPIDMRTEKVPRASQNASKLGFGQSNIWYANKPEHKEFVKNIVNYIENNSHEHSIPQIFPETDIIDAVYEGAIRKISVNKYERSSIARQKCIQYHGCKCIVCGLEFEKVYGEIGKNFIHVHHLTPLNEIGKEYIVDYKNDLIPVCPNCHAMLHREIDGKRYSWQELREKIKK